MGVTDIIRQHAFPGAVGGAIMLATSYTILSLNSQVGLGTAALIIGVLCSLITGGAVAGVIGDGSAGGSADGIASGVTAWFFLVTYFCLANFSWSCLSIPAISEIGVIIYSVVFSGGIIIMIGMALAIPGVVGGIVGNGIHKQLEPDKYRDQPGGRIDTE
jgi:hypothetical protein